MDIAQRTFGDDRLEFNWTLPVYSSYQLETRSEVGPGRELKFELKLKFKFEFKFKFKNERKRPGAPLARRNEFAAAPHAVAPRRTPWHPAA